MWILVGTGNHNCRQVSIWILCLHYIWWHQTKNTQMNNFNFIHFKLNFCENIVKILVLVCRHWLVKSQNNDNIGPYVFHLMESSFSTDTDTIPISVTFSTLTLTLKWPWPIMVVFSRYSYSSEQAVSP